MSEDERPTISCNENGPYVVRRLANFSSSAGHPIPTRAILALCRCGASRKKPFCDGSHVAAGFKSEKLPGRQPDRRDDYPGHALTIHDNRGLCSHAGHCTDALPQVWRMRSEPWIDPEAAPPEEIVAVVGRCPSGALSCSVEGVEHRDREGPPAIQLSKDGPYRVTGGVLLEDVEHLEGASEEHFTLCRCGRSRNKPFCDGMHWHARFRDSEASLRPDRPAGRVWQRVAGPDDELAKGSVKTVTAGGRRLVLVRTEKGYAVLESTCPHQGGPLSEGQLDGGVLRCPWHGWGFAVADGKATRAGRPDVPVYDLEERDDGLYVGLPAAPPASRTVSHVMVETMVNWGVSHVFGMVGHSNLGLADAVREECERGYLTYVGIRHEGAAAFACSAFAKLSGRPAACLTIAGPGGTNLLTGLWDAHVDRAPVLALTGQVQGQVLGPGAFQEIDLASAFEAVATWSRTVLPTSRPAELMNLALKHAIVERGVAHLIFPDEVQTQPVPDDTPPSRPEGRVAPAVILPPDETIWRLADRAAAARRPTLVVGHGAREAMPAVIALAERLGAPLLTTFKAKGQVSDEHPLATGVLGRSGTPVAAWAMDRADLLVVFGASFSNHTGIDPVKPTIQVDIDRLALGRFHAVSIPVWGEAAVTAQLMLEALPDRPQGDDVRPQLGQQWSAWRAEKVRRAGQHRGRGLSAAAVFAALTRLAPEDAVVVVDVGDNTYSFGRYFECRRQSVLMSGYLGSIGFGLPGALGAWAAAPDRRVIVVCGDGGFAQYMAEFTTAVQHGMGISVLLLNNGELGKISREQRAGQWPVWQTALHNPDFAAFARNCGGVGLRTEHPDELDDALAAVLAPEGPALLEVMTDPDLV